MEVEHHDKALALKKLRTSATKEDITLTNPSSSKVMSGGVQVFSGEGIYTIKSKGQ